MRSDINRAQHVMLTHGVYAALGSYVYASARNVQENNAPTADAQPRDGLLLVTVGDLSSSFGDRALHGQALMMQVDSEEARGDI